MVSPVNSWNRDEQATRQSLIEKLQGSGSKDGWEEFYEAYAEMIFKLAVQKGLSPTEADDVVQETIISVYKQMPQFTYNPQQGSFKGWLYNLVQWRITDQFRKRTPESPARRENYHAPVPGRTATVERVADPNGNELEAEWDAQFQQTTVDKALLRLRRKVKTKHYQIFDLVFVQGRPIREVAASFGISAANVYLIRHRLGALLKREVKSVRDGLSLNPAKSPK